MWYNNMGDKYMDYKIIHHELGKDPLYKIWHASALPMFMYMHSDGGSIVCSEKSYPIQKGVLCLVGAGKYHYTVPDIPERYDRSKLFVSADEIDKILEMLSVNTNKFSSESFVYALIDENERNKVENIFCKIKEYENDKSYGKWILTSCIIELFVFLNKYSLENIPAASGVVSRAIEYINSNIEKNITIDEICSEIHMSKYHFCRQFKKVTDTTVMKYILKTRIVMAKNMLLNDNLSITEISNRCGFSSVSYFSRVFKEETGRNPLNYKKEGKI